MHARSQLLLEQFRYRRRRVYDDHAKYVNEACGNGRNSFAAASATLQPHFGEVRDHVMLNDHGSKPTCGEGGELQVLGLCCARHQSNDIWDKLSSGSGQEGDVCHAAAMCTSRHQGPCYAVQAI